MTTGITQLGKYFMTAIKFKLKVLNLLNQRMGILLDNFAKWYKFYFTVFTLYNKL